MERETPIEDTEYEHYVRQKRLVGTESLRNLLSLLDISNALKRLQKRCNKYLETYAKTGKLKCNGKLF